MELPKRLPEAAGVVVAGTTITLAVVLSKGESDAKVVTQDLWP